MDNIKFEKKVFESIQSLVKTRNFVVTSDTVLLGENGVLDSLSLVELCLMLEDFANENGFEFDWTSESALSKSRSMFRTAGTLSSTFIGQSKNII